jgi:hypothetical protein
MPGSNIVLYLQSRVDEERNVLSSLRRSDEEFLRCAVSFPPEFPTTAHNKRLLERLFRMGFFA